MQTSSSPALRIHRLQFRPHARPPARAVAKIIALDKLTYCGNLANLQGVLATIVDFRSRRYLRSR